MIGVLAHDLEDLLSLLEIGLPLRRVVVRLSLLEPFQDQLVFESDSHEGKLPLVVVETFPR